MKTGHATTAPPKTSTGIDTRVLFVRMGRQITRLTKEMTPENVHHFRTNSRRVEAVVEQLAPDDKSDSKLLKQLSKLRKRAGQVRDLDVQIAFLKELKIPDRQNHRAQLLQDLEQEKLRRRKKLAVSFDNDTVRKLRNRLRKAKAELKLFKIDPLKLAFSRLPQPASTPLSEKELHACRIATKRARYLAELSDTATAKQFVEELKRAQDAVGEWHDVLKLAQRAEKLFGDVRDSSLVAALQNISRARFRRAGSTLIDALHAVAELKQKETATRKAPAPVSTASRTAAA